MCATNSAWRPLMAATRRRMGADELYEPSPELEEATSTLRRQLTPAVVSKLRASAVLELYCGHRQREFPHPRRLAIAFVDAKRRTLVYPVAPKTGLAADRHATPHWHRSCPGAGAGRRPVPALRRGTGPGGHGWPATSLGLCGQC